MPLIVQSTKQNTTLFNLSTIKTQMQIATNSKTTQEETRVAIVKMYQNGTIKNLSSQAQKAAHALAQYIHKHKAKQTFAFVLGKDYQDHHLLLLTIANHLAKPKVDASLQKPIPQASINTQKQEDPSLVKQLPWVTTVLQKAEFGILFWIYQHRLSSQEALPGIKQVPAPITAVNFQRVKTPHEQLQAQAWAKIIQVVYDLTSSKLKIHGDAQQLPSQTKITTRDIVLAIQKIIIANDAISKAASKLMKVDNIEVQPDDKIGAIMITIKNYGHDKIITILGFKATRTPLAIAQAKIDVAKDGASLPTRLNQVFHDQTPKASDVNAPTKNGVTFKFKLATAVNSKGESTLTYEVDADPQVDGTTPQDVTFVVSGFETKGQKDAREVIKKRLDTTMQNIHDGALVIPEGITSSQFDEYVQAMGDVLNEKGELVMNKFAEKYRTKITSLTIPSSFTMIGPWFQYFTKIILLRIPNSVTTIGEYAFFSAPLTSLHIPNLVTAIGNYAFEKALLTSLRIPNLVTTIGTSAFAYSPLTTLTLGEALQTIGDLAFQGARLKSLHIPNSVTTIGNHAFQLSPLTSLSLGNHLQTIGTHAFSNAQLTSLRIPDSVTAIRDFAFVNSPLTIITIFDDVKLGGWTFRDPKIIKRIPRPS